jgi:D-alanyl-D-alanine dipeptidase
VVGGPKQRYVGDPAIGSIHGYGLAVDATLLHPDGGECDMGTAFDDFSPLAEPQREDAFLAEGRLTPPQVRNRRLLRDAMLAGGFRPIAIEWWHFDALPPDEVRRRFPLVE